MSIDIQITEIIKQITSNLFNEKEYLNKEQYFMKVITQIDEMKIFLEKTFDTFPKQNTSFENYFNDNNIIVTNMKDDILKVKEIFNDFKNKNPNTKLKFGSFKNILIKHPVYKKYFKEINKCNILIGVKFS